MFQKQAATYQKTSKIGWELEPFLILSLTSSRPIFDFAHIKKKTKKYFFSCLSFTHCITNNIYNLVQLDNYTHWPPDKSQTKWKV